MSDSEEKLDLQLDQIILEMEELDRRWQNREVTAWEYNLGMYAFGSQIIGLGRFAERAGFANQAGLSKWEQYEARIDSLRISMLKDLGIEVKRHSESQL